MPPNPGVTYSLDTSVLLTAWWRTYPPDLFPTLWDNLDGLFASGHLLASEEVLVELEKKDDEVYGWAKQRSGMFVPIDDAVQQAVSSIMQAHPRLIDNRPERSGADPFVIGFASVNGYTVLTEEHATGSATRPNIPDVCSALEVPWTNLVGCIREQGWKI